MTVFDLVSQAFELQADTYFSLGLATPGAQLIVEPGFKACTGPVDHPICNFATNLKLDPWVVNRLADVALSREAFNVYSSPGDEPSQPNVRHELLSRSGFEHNFGLNQLIATGHPESNPVELRNSQTLRERREICLLMSTIFFQQHSAAFRRRVVDATVHSPNLELHGLFQRGELIGACMLAQSAQLVGLFNLCVRPQLQGRGWGMGIVSAVQKMAYENGKAVTLQCDDSLLGWYESQGFQKTGVIDVYVLPRTRRIAIMN